MAANFRHYFEFFSLYNIMNPEMVSALGLYDRRELHRSPGLSDAYL